MPNEIDTAAEQLLSRMSANAKQADQTQILHNIEQRLKLLGGETIEEAYEKLSPESKYGVFLKAIVNSSITEILEFEATDPHMQAIKGVFMRALEQPKSPIFD